MVYGTDSRRSAGARQTTQRAERTSRSTVASKRCPRSHEKSYDGVMTTLPDRFWSKVDRSGGPEACWPWTAYCDPAGYGRYGRNGKSERAYRLTYIDTVGPIESGLHLDHLCRNRRCVNPAHLEPVTPRLNVLRGVGPAARHATKDRCDAGHLYVPETTYVHPVNGRRVCRVCQRQWQREHQQRHGRAPLPAEYWRAYRAQRKAAGKPIRHS